MQPKSLKLVLTVVLVLSLAFAASGCRKKSRTAELDLKPGKAGAASAPSAGSSSSTSTTEAPKSSASPSASTSTGTGSNASGSGSNASNGTGSGGGSSTGGSGSGTGTKPSPSTKGLVVKILWWNDTKTKAPNGCEIVYGSSSFKPVATKDAASGSIGPVPYRKSVQLVIYPDGRSGKKILVPFVVDSGMNANSDRDAIHVQISDAEVRVLGNAVDGFDKTFDRF